MRYGGKGFRREREKCMYDAINSSLPTILLFPNLILALPRI